MVNVVKHARAEHLIIRLIENGNGVTVTVEDDGVGIPAAIISRPVSAEGFGLMSILERIRDLGGSFTLARRPGGGTIARLEFLQTVTTTTAAATAQPKEYIHACLH